MVSDAFAQFHEDDFQFCEVPGILVMTAGISSLTDSSTSNLGAFPNNANPTAGQSSPADGNTPDVPVNMVATPGDAPAAASNA